MQLKGLVKLFTGILILYCLYQISYTFIVRGTDQKLKAKAEKQAKATGLTGAALEQATEARLQAITDSVQGEKIVGTLFGKVTYADAKKKELNLGLDLQGGMSVTLDVSLNDLVRSMSNNPADPALLNAIAEADRLHTNSDKDFAALFRQAYEAKNPNARMAYLFTKPNFTDITLQSSNEDVERVIRRNGSDAIESTYGILQKRIDKFGVSQPTINLDKNRGIITVELAGVKNPDRVRDLLQSTANLQFFETFTNAEIYQTLEAANNALAAKLSGKSATDTAQNTVAAGDTTGTKTDTTGPNTASLDQFQGGANTKDSQAVVRAENEAKYPLLGRMIIPQEIQQRPGPVVCYVAKADTAKVMGYLRMDVVRSKFPNTVRFMFGAETGEDRFNAKAPLALYAIKTAPGTPNGSKLEGNHVVDARMDLDRLNGKPQVLMDMDPSGSRIWSKMTGDNINKSVAVVLDDRVYSAPNVENQIDGGSTVISGRFSVQEATDLANILKIGKLPARPRIVQEQVVGPSLGEENVSAGMNSLLIAFAVIFILMLVYYNTAGMVANIALILNLLFTVGILIDLGATLTMPGIAGLVLTIGMAVDTNVIIFERIKEELALGKSYELAVSEGYKRSYAPVLDGHITQLLTAIILFVAGLGPVKGFATTQILGLLLSLFCGIVVSRLVTDMWMSRGKHFNYFTSLSKSIFRKAHFRFIEFRKVTYVISAIVFGLGIASYFHGYDKGVEFAGGRSYTVHFDKKVNENDVRQKLASYLETQPVVKTVGTNNDLSITTTYLINNTDTGTTATVARRLQEGLSKSGLLTTASYDEFARNNLKNTQTVLPTISKKLQKDAITATIIALSAIFLYIFIRFRKWQYSVGTIIALLHDVCITLAVFSFLRGVVPFALELDQHFIAAVLTVIGFSMNDTVIVFDRVREYFRKSPGERKESVINRAINDTLSRTVMTSLTVFLTILILFIFGGEVTRGFAFAMLIGVITGTYSSIFVAAPILVDMDKGDSLKNEVDRTEQIEELKKMA